MVDFIKNRGIISRLTGGKMDLSKVFSEIGAEKTFNETVEIKDFDRVKFASVSGKIKNRAGVVYYNCNVNFILETFCDRCLAEVKRNIEEEFSHILTLKENPETDDFITVCEKAFDLSDLVREDIIISLSSKILCKDDCRGLCSICGKNLNDGPCDCERPKDTRWSALDNIDFDN